VLRVLGQYYLRIAPGIQWLMLVMPYLLREKLCNYRFGDSGRGLGPGQ